MEYKNDERYWNIKLLNKWFAISSILFLVSFMWMFYHDNDDEFKNYQREFRKLEIEVAEKKLDEALDKTKAQRSEFETKYNDALLLYNNKSAIIDSINTNLESLNGLFYKANMDFLFQKAEVDGLKYLYEDEIVHSSHYEKNEESHSSDSHDYEHKDKYLSSIESMNELKLIKEDLEKQVLTSESILKEMRSELKIKEDELNNYLKEVDLINNKLTKLDRTKMSYLNQLGDLVRDLPILDFMDPYYRVNQVVAHDIKYDVNFASVPSVDRCTSCHLGISNPDFKDAPQPFTSHPDLDLFVSTSSPHPFEQYGCTSCHSGRGRGTDFVSTVHMPGSAEQKKEWEEKYNWKKMHHWLQPMLPTKYTQASCFKCHESQPILDGGDKLALGLMLIDKAGCNNCHHIESYASTRKGGPPLTHLEEKVNKEWVRKWIKDPQSFRYNTWMPHFFSQDNNSDDASIIRNETEVYAITEYLFPKGDKTKFNNSSSYLGDAENGEKLFNAVGCRGCHVVDEKSIQMPENMTDYNMLTSKFGYEVDSTGSNYEKLNRYALLKYQGPNLIGLGSKTDAEWIYNWIKNPQNYWHETKMPSLRLSHDESKDITAYLMTSKNKEFDNNKYPDLNEDELKNITSGWLVKSFPQKDADEKLLGMNTDDMLNYVAKKSINYYGCYTCHLVDGFEDAKPIGTELTTEASKPVAKLDFGHIHDIGHTNYEWFEQKLANPRIFDKHKIIAHEDKLRMPNFYFKPEEIEAIVTAILGFTNNKVADSKITYNLVDDKSIFEGYSLINKYNCQGCHEIDGFGGQIADVIGAVEYSPPNLNTQGSKTQPDWLFEFFKNPSIIRPNLQVRMPSFDFTDSQWNSIIKAFQHMDERNLMIEGHFNVDIGSSKYKAGKVLENKGLCNNCHFYGDRFPIQNADTWAPNLVMTKDRLRPEWVVKWLENPVEIMPGTKMPKPFLPSKKSLSSKNAIDKWGQDLIDLDADKELMLEALRDYIYTIEGSKDISKLVQDYFKIHGYDFSPEEDEEEFEDEEW